TPGPLSAAVPHCPNSPVGYEHPSCLPGYLAAPLVARPTFGRGRRQIAPVDAQASATSPHAESTATLMKPAASVCAAFLLSRHLLHRALFRKLVGASGSWVAFVKVVKPSPVSDFAFEDSLTSGTKPCLSVIELTSISPTPLHLISTHLLLILAAGRVQRLDERGGVAHEHGVAGGTHDHAEDSEPHVCHSHWGVHAVANAQHVAHGLEQGIRVLLAPGVILQDRMEEQAIGGEVLQHGHQELQAAIPVAQQQHHADQVDDAHHGTGQVVEGDAHGDDDQIAHHQQQHGQVPVESKKGSSTMADEDVVDNERFEDYCRKLGFVQHLCTTHVATVQSRRAATEKQSTAFLSHFSNSHAVNDLEAPYQLSSSHGTEWQRDGGARGDGSESGKGGSRGIEAETDRDWKLWLRSRRQNAAARIVFHLPKRSHLSPLLVSLRCLPIAARIRFKTLVMA
ncbi:hypothetical protein Z043_120381, partial [Scleropages formosus]